MPGLDAVDHEARFVEFVEGAVEGNRLAFAAFGPQIFAHAPVVVGDQGVGRFQDVAGGTVVLLQADGFRAGEILQEALDVFHLRAAPAVDRLVIVADDHHVAVAARQQADPGVLDAVGILEFVHQHVGETLAVVVEDMRLVQPQLVRAQQQLGEIHQPGAIAGFLIGLIDAQPGGLYRVVVGLDVLRAQALVFLAVDVPHRLTRRPLLLIDVQRLDDALEQPQLVVAVEDLEILRQVGFQVVGAQQTMRQAVEGADPHAALAGADQMFDTVAHFRRRLVGEGHRHDRIRRTVLHRQQPGDAMHQYPRLAAARPGQNQQVAARRRHGFTLFFIQAVEQIGDVHRHH